MFRLRWASVLAVPVLLAAGCSSGVTSTVATSACQPHGSKLRVVANNLLFDADCYAVPANQPFTVTLANKDEASHNFSLYRTDGTPISRGPIVEPHQSDSEDFAALAPGTYVFRCDVHPAMTGDFVVA